MSYATAESNSKTATDFTSIAGVVIGGRRGCPVNLARFDDRNWMTAEKPIWFIAEHLCAIPHISLLTPAMEKNLTRLDRRTMSGEMVGHRKKNS
ncbi:MAG: hypothetical protein WA269_07465 [Candidatus Udaeobacter sp.]